MIALWALFPVGRASLAKVIPALIAGLAFHEASAKNGADDGPGDDDGSHPEPGDDKGNDIDGDGRSNGHDDDVDGDGDATVMTATSMGTASATASMAISMAITKRTATTAIWMGTVFVTGVTRTSMATASLTMPIRRRGGVESSPGPEIKSRRLAILSRAGQNSRPPGAGIFVIADGPPRAISCSKIG